MAINTNNQPSDITSDVKEILGLVRAIKQHLDRPRNPSGTIEVYGVITRITPTKTRSGIKNISLREADGTHRWLRASPTVSSSLENGQHVWVRGISRVEKRKLSEHHIIYIDHIDDIKILEKS